MEACYTILLDPFDDSLLLSVNMSALRVSRAALRARPAISLRPIQRRGYADAVSDKIKLSLALPHQVCWLRDLRLPSPEGWEAAVFEEIVEADYDVDSTFRRSTPRQTCMFRPTELQQRHPNVPTSEADHSHQCPSERPRRVRRNGHPRTARPFN